MMTASGQITVIIRPARRSSCAPQAPVVTECPPALARRRQDRPQRPCHHHPAPDSGGHPVNVEVFPQHARKKLHAISGRPSRAAGGVGGSGRRGGLGRRAVAGTDCPGMAEGAISCGRGAAGSRRSARRLPRRPGPKLARVYRCARLAQPAALCMCEACMASATTPLRGVIWCARPAGLRMFPCRETTERSQLPAGCRRHGAPCPG